MKGHDRRLAWRVAFALVLALAVPSRGRAQEEASEEAAVPPTETETESESATESAPPRARRESDPPEDELDESIRSGPTLAQREAASRRGHPLDRPNYASDPADLELPVTVMLALGGGATLTGSSFDSVLLSHDFSTSSALYVGDITVLGRVFDSWLFVGGRLGGRARTFVRNDGPGGSAGAVDLQAIVMARFQLGRVIDLGVHVGGGGAVVGVALHDGASMGIAPRLTGGVHLGFRLTRGIRLFLRGSYDFCRWFAMDRYGDELELGGLTALVGFEVRS